VDCLQAQEENQHQFIMLPKNITQTQLEKKRYFCTEECKIAGRDKKFVYSKSFINAMLNYEGYRDSIRQNDGCRMNSYNKIQLVQFFNKRHTNYLKSGFLWILRKAGWSEPQVAFDLLHNSTINMSGR
jgi:hypothetical protein